MVSPRLFALDCVTFQADTRKINPAPWTDRAGDTGPFIVPWTAPHLATGPTVKRGGWGGKIEMRRKREERGHRPHTHSCTSCLLMSLQPEIFGCKQMTMDACRIEDWFTYELFEEIYEEGRIFIRTGEGENKWKKSNKLYEPTGQMPEERWNTEREEPDKNTNEEPVAEKGDSWHMVESKSTKGGLRWKSNLSRWTEKFHWLWIF